MSRRSEDIIHENTRKAELRKEDGRLVLTDGTLRLFADFSSMSSRLAETNLRRELLVKAAGRPDPCKARIAVDATAGLGEDSLLLAACGFYVHLYENDPIIASLLEDGIRRGLEDPALSPYLHRMTLHKEDSIPAMENLSFVPDVIYLDPMFPARRKNAKVKKKFQLLQLLEAPCADGDVLFTAACSAGPGRIVVKRPAKGEYLAGRRPSYSLFGNTIRYDVIIP